MELFPYSSFSFSPLLPRLLSLTLSNVKWRTTEAFFQMVLVHVEALPAGIFVTQFNYHRCPPSPPPPFDPHTLAPSAYSGLNIFNFCSSSSSASRLPHQHLNLSTPPHSPLYSGLCVGVGVCVNACVSVRVTE